MKQVSIKVRGLCLRFLNNMGSGLVVGLGSGSIYRIIQICVPYLTSKPLTDGYDLKKN